MKLDDRGLPLPGPELDIRAEMMQLADQYLLASFGVDKAMFQQEQTFSVKDFLDLLDNLRPWKYALSELVEVGSVYAMGGMKIVVIHPDDEGRLVRMLVVNNLPVLKLGGKDGAE